MTSPNGLICFTNCLLSLENGSLVEKDLWIDERRGVILDAQVRHRRIWSKLYKITDLYVQRAFFLRKERPARIVDLGGNILRFGTRNYFAVFHNGRLIGVVSPVPGSSISK